MKPPTQLRLQAFFVLLVAAQIAQEVRAYHAGGHKNHHHELHHPGHHEGHHHSSHHGHHGGGGGGARSARNRREKEAPGDLTENKDAAVTESTVSGQNGVFPCVTGGSTSECSLLQRSTCDGDHKRCVCPVDYPTMDAKNGFCVTEAKLKESCQFNSECEESDEYSFCGPDYTCACQPGYDIDEYPNVGFQCVSKEPKSGPGTVDPAMIGVLVGLALMFVIICVVLRLFSKARFRENRSIFNTPNPRLMNASLFKDSTVAGRRGSAMSQVSATGSAAGGAPPKTPSPAKETKAKAETTVAIENVD